MPLITSDDLRTYLAPGAQESPARLAFFADGASSYLTERLGRSWEQAERTERLRGTGTEYLVLRHYPVAALTRIRVKGVELDLDPDTGVAVLENPRNGVVARVDGNVWADERRPTIEVTYTGGPAAVPADVKLAALELAAWAYQTTGGRTWMSDSGTNASFASLAANGAEDLPLVRAAIANYADVLK